MCLGTTGIAKTAVIRTSICLGGTVTFTEGWGMAAGELSGTCSARLEKTLFQQQYNAILLANVYDGPVSWNSNGRL